MRSKTLVGLALTVLLASCGYPADRDVPGSGLAAGEAATAEAAAGDMAATPADVASAAPAPSPQVKVPAGVPMLAYSYFYGVEGSPKAVRVLAARHEASCVKAGPAVCQVIGSSLNARGDDRVSLQLSMRAAPAWLTRFRQGLTEEAKAEGGRVNRSDVTSEDLSRQIVDTEARLRAQTTLRDRLQALLATRPGKLADLVELERELARVQGELDAAQSQLAVMRQRIATSQIEITYESAGVLAPQGVWSPLARAFGDFLAIVAYTLAGLVRFVAWTAPWLLIGGLLAWLFRKRIPRFRFRKSPPPPAV